MIHQFFTTQWNNPTKGDWTETVRNNLEEFGLPEDFGFLKSKSKSSFKNLVKKKAREIALEQLLENKEKHSKMKNLDYSELKLQQYFQLPEISIAQARNIFKYRTRMLPFGENFRGQKESVICPLCHTHPDSQVWCLRCPAMRKEISDNANVDDIHTDELKMDTVQAVEEILKVRQNILESKSK